MVEAWFALVCFALIVFAALDGVTIGAGVVSSWVARTPDERRRVIEALGPLWSWNEVWLVVAGGMLLLAFPRVLAVAFSGFYLALWLVLWAIVLRGIAVEVGGHLDDALWRAAWDFVFAASSVLLALLFGVALGSVIRGVPLDASRRFNLSLFTDLRATGRVGLLDWYTLSTAVLTTTLLSAHGATALARQTGGDLRARSIAAAQRLWIASALLFVVVSIATWWLRPDLVHTLTRPVALAGLAAIATGSVVVWRARRTPHQTRAVLGSTAIVAGLLVTAAAATFPVVLRSTIAPQFSLTAYAGASSPRSLLIGLWWWPLAAVLAFAYAAMVTRGYQRKEPLDTAGSTLERRVSL